MSKKSRNGCGWECCPEGIIEHIKNYRYSRWAYGVGFWEYWGHELKTLTGLNRTRKMPTKDCKECREGECYEHNYFSPEFLEELKK